MSKVKYIIFFFLFLCAFLFIGESYTFYLENFQNDYVEVHYYLETGDSESEMNEYILQQAEQFNTSVFALDKIDNGAFSRNIIIYGNEEIQAALKSDWNLFDRTVKSFFSGTTTFSFAPFEEADENAMSHCYYINVSADEIYNMLYPNMVQYSGSIQNVGNIADGKYVVIGIFSIALFFILVLTTYDIAYNKKEYYVRILLGDDNKKIIGSKILNDSCGLIFVALTAFTLTYFFTSPQFEIGISAICIVLLLITNSLLITLQMKTFNLYDLKNVIGRKILSCSLLLKCVVSILAILVFSVTIGLAVEGIKLYLQAEYYETQDNRVHVDIRYPYDYSKFASDNGSSQGVRPLDAREQINDNFLRYSYKHLDCSLLYYEDSQEIAPKYGDKYVYANLRGLLPYQEHISDWHRISTQEGNYVLVSDKVDLEDVINEIPSLTGITEDNLSGIVTYSDGLSIIAEGKQELVNDYTYTVKNPVILLDTYNYGSLDNYTVSYSLRDSGTHDGIIFNDMMYLLQFTTLTHQQSELNKFPEVIAGESIKPALVKLSVENVGDWFDGLWELQNRSLLIAVILTVLLLVLEIQTAILLFRIYYETKAKEITARKILGYSIFDRFKSIFFIISLACILTLVSSLVISQYLQIGFVKYIVLSCIVVFVTDVIMSAFLIKNMDRLQIQKVLKGGI